MMDANVLVETAETLWNLAIDITNRSRLYHWMKNPRPGDFVFVWMTRPDTPAEQRVGVYDSTWCFIHPEESDFPLPSQHRAEQIYRIILVNGEPLNWSNCQLLRLPRNREERLDAMYEPCGECGSHVGHQDTCSKLWRSK